MESLDILEKKIAQLVQFIQTLKQENSTLGKENAGLKKKLAALEDTVLKGNASIETLSTEREQAKHCVTDLIKNIDQLIASGN
jgi:hypothetical protein